MAALVLCAASCKKEKEDPIEPTKKLAEWSLEQADSTITPRDVFVWNGDNLVSITRHWITSSGEPTIEYFTCKDGRVVSEEYRSISVSYSYDGDKLIAIASNDTNPRYAVWKNNWQFEYDGDKIVKCTHTFQGALAGSTGAVTNRTITQNITWTGDNPTKIEENTILNGENAGTTIYEFTYDGKSNPRYGQIFYCSLYYVSTINFYGPHNILTVKKTKISDSGEVAEPTYEYYEYTYDADGYPISYIASDGTSQWKYLYSYVEK